MEMILLGALALFNAIATPISSLICGWLLIGAGILQLVNSGRNSAVAFTKWHLLSALPDLLAGLYFTICRPGVGGMIVGLAIALAVGGVLRFFAVFEANERHKRWRAFEAFSAIVISLLLYTSLPPNGMWFIGFALALSLMIRGWSSVMVNAAMRVEAPLAI